MINQKDLQKNIDARSTDFASNAGGDRISRHTHDGILSPQISSKNLLPYPIITVADASVAPTDSPQNVTIRFYIDKHSGVAHWYQWVFLPNALTGGKTWVKVALTT